MMSEEIFTFGKSQMVSKKVGNEYLEYLKAAGDGVMLPMLLSRWRS